MDDLDKKVDSIRYQLANMTLQGFAIKDLLENLQNTDWNLWLVEAQQRQWPIVACNRCHHNFLWGEEVAAQRDYAGVCDACWEAIQHPSLQCILCKHIFVKDVTRPRNSLPDCDPHKGPLCDTCLEMLLENYRVPCARCGKSHVAYSHISLSLCK